MPSAEQVPVNSPHSTMRWHKWVVLIAGSTGSALRTVRPPNLHITPDVGAISFTPQVRRVPCSARPWHHRPDHPRNLVGERDGSHLRRSPRQQCREPGPMFGAMDLGIADDGERTGDEQAAQIPVTLLANMAEPVLYLRSSATSAPARSRPRNCALIGRP